MIKEQFTDNKHVQHKNYYSIVIETPREYEYCNRRLPFRKTRARGNYFRTTGEFVLYYIDEYDRDYDYMLYTQPVVYPVI